MQANRRGFLQTVGLNLVASGLALGPSVAASAAPQNGAPASPSRRRARRRRIIVNRDAGLPTVWDKGREHYINTQFPHLEGEGTQVDTVFWCFDEGTTAGYESSIRELQHNWDTSQTSPGLATMVAQGHDPPKVVIAECRRRNLEVFYSFRINGHEDSYIPAEVPAFKKDHPEYTLKGHVPDKVWAALNFAIPAVREQRLAVIQEVLDKYDFDGIEIDWMRSPYYFREHQEYRLRYLLTDMMRAIRHMVDARSKQVGRKLGLAVRVAESLESCLLDGYDVEVWAKEGLMDILVLGSGATYCDIPTFRRITAGTDIAVYPCVYRYGQFYKEYAPLIIRGIAANYWIDQPDGMYTFNYFGSSAPPQFKEIGALETLEGLDKMFVAYIGLPGAPDPYYPHNWMFTPLPAELWPVYHNTPLTVPLIIGDDLAAATQANLRADLRLRVILEGATEEDRITVSLNGRELKLQRFEPGAPPDAKIKFDGGSLIYAPEPARCRHGRNEVGIVATERVSNLKPPAIVHAVDMLVQYRA